MAHLNPNPNLPNGWLSPHSLSQSEFVVVHLIRFRTAYYGCSASCTAAEDFSSQGYSGYSIFRPAAAVLPWQFGLDRVLVGDAPLDLVESPARRGSARLHPARTSPSRLPALLNSATHAVATCDSDDPARSAATAAIATRKPRLLR
jgi:hypothetical protein